MNYLKKAGKLLIAACLFAGTSLTSQMITASELQTHIMTVQNESTTLKELFDLIEEKFDYSFLIRNNDIDLNERITIDMTDRSVEEILNYALKNQQAEFVVNNDRIVVYKSNTPKQTEAVTTPIAQQNQRITGVVVDQTTGEPVIGANVLMKGTTNGTSTDFDGNFSLEVPSGATLVVSYIGYVNLEIAATANMTIRLREDTQALDEVVVVGYTTRRRESLTGALQTLSNEKITNITSPNVENMLTGKAPGVYVSPGTGEPGSRGKIVIRGKSSLNGLTDPLWVIDGVIVGNKSDNSLNPTDIETMTILKDAASTAIYGSQGANGVILVTTKKAKGDKLTLNASAKLGVNVLSMGHLEMMNGAELYDYYKSFANQEMISFPRWNENLRNSNYDWFDELSQTGFTQDYNISLSGGNENIRSFFSAGVYKEEGAVIGYDMTRYSFRFKTDYNVTDWLTIKPSISGSKSDTDSNQADVTAFYTMLPWDNPYKANGTPEENRTSEWVNSNTTNPMRDRQWNNTVSNRYAIMANMDFNVRITDWLNFVSINNYSWDNYSYMAYQDPRSNAAMGVNGRINEVDYKTERRYSNHILNFNKTFGKHAVSALAAYEFNDYKQKWIQAIGTGFNPGFEILNVTALPEKTAGSITEDAMQSYIFKANYAYDNKYLGEVSFRRDGASNFGDNAKYGNFYSVSAGWNIHREEFFQAYWVDNLKLRISYGSVGNRPFDKYPQYDLYGVSQSYSYNTIPGSLITQIGNKDLTWEKNYTFGLGLDFGAFDRLRISMDYYNKQTDNVLFKVPISGLTGVTSIWQNVGELENKGFEVTIGGDIVRTKDWYFGMDFNLGLNRNKVKALYGGLTEIIDPNIGSVGSASRLLQPGYDSDTWFIREWAGVNPETGKAQWYKNDGTREITENYAEAQEVAMGAYTPDFFGGFSFDLTWKNIDMNALFGYSVGGKIYNYSRQEYDSDGAYSDRNQMKLKSGWSRWEKPGDIATHPQPSYNNTINANSNKSSSRYLEDGDYLKLRSLSIGYNLSLAKYSLPNLRIFLTGENLFTITGYSGVDPEIPTKDDSNGNPQITGSTGPSARPLTRKFMFGINITL